MAAWLTGKQLRTVAQLCQTSAGLVWIKLWGKTCSDRRWGTVHQWGYYITSIAQQGSAELYSKSESSLMISDHTPLPWNGGAWSFIWNGIYKITDMDGINFCLWYEDKSNIAAISAKVKLQNWLLKIVGFLFLALSWSRIDFFFSFWRQCFH